MLTTRSAQIEIRNPLLTLPAVRKLQALPAEHREAIADLLKELAGDANDRAEKSWRKSKGPMAAYWKAVGVYAKHLRAAIRKGVAE